MVPVVTRAWNEEFSTSRTLHQFVELNEGVCTCYKIARAAKIAANVAPYVKRHATSSFKQQILTLNLSADIWAYLTIPGKFICQD